MWPAGTAGQSDAAWWIYVTHGQTGASRRVDVTVLNLPGNTAQHTWQSD